MPYKNKEKRKEYQRLWVAKRRQEWFADKSCVKCDSTDRLELDHIDPTKKISHSIWSWSQEKRDNEIKKCQVLCHDCHKKKTRLYLSTIIHGITFYNKHRCRCDICREAKSLALRRQRFNNKNPIGVAMDTRIKPDDVLNKTIELVEMLDDPDPIPVGTKGVVVTCHTGYGYDTLGVVWENKRSLNLIVPPDKYVIVEEKKN